MNAEEMILDDKGYTKSQIEEIKQSISLARQEKIQDMIKIIDDVCNKEIIEGECHENKNINCRMCQLTNRLRKELKSQLNSQETKRNISNSLPEGIPISDNCDKTPDTNSPDASKPTELEDCSAEPSGLHTLSDKILPSSPPMFYLGDVKEAIKKLNEGIPMTTTMAGIKSKDYWKGVNDMIKRANEIFGKRLVEE